MKKTKIIATLGPCSSSVENIISLIQGGMDIARINLSHGDRKSHLQLITYVKKARKQLNTHTAILLDTRGPEIRVQELEEGIVLVEGKEVLVSGHSGPDTGLRILVNHSEIANEVKKGDKILLDDGKMVLQVKGVELNDIVTRVVVGGVLTSRKRVSLPGVETFLPSVSEEDREDLLFGIEQGVDFIAASFIRRAEDVIAVKEIVHTGGGQQDVIAKIENRQGVVNLQEILEVSDGIMVARGDLGVELAAEEVPVIQKKIIHAANSAGKPVITATQMLESMISSPTPTRAEATDVANAVIDGTDAVMLSAETAMGKYPREAVNFLARCTKIAESTLDYRAILFKGLHQCRPVVSDAIAYASCAIATDVEAAAILTITTSGSTARKVAMYRPRSPIVALSPLVETIRKLQIVRGVTPLVCEHGRSMDAQIESGVRAALNAGVVEYNNKVAITAGLPLQTTGTTNMLRVHTITREMV